MKWSNLLRIAFMSIVKSRMRSLLTALGIIIGVGAVVIMVAIGEGAQADIESQINSLGSNLIVVFPASAKSFGISRGAGSYNKLTLEDVEKLEEEASLINVVSPLVQTGAQVVGGGNNWNTKIYGVAENYLQIRSWDLKYGEYFTERDVISRGKVAVIGKEVADNLFPGQDPVGEQILIKNVPFKVIGVLEEKGQSAMGMNYDDLILAPSTTVLYRLAGGSKINMIYASAVSVEQIDNAQEELRLLLREAHRIEPGEDDDFMIRNQTEIIEAASESSETMTIMLGAVASVSLIVGGIGIMNIMLVSVTERTREIGIRLSIGARERDILIQFLMEAMVLSLVGGIIGLLISVGVVYLLNEYTNQTAMINPTIIFIAFIFSGVVGVFFGFYPARKAASLNPIDALRYE
jgi:putative ABC transport system permease protein